MQYNGTFGKKILCIRLDNMGDIIMTTPAFRALRETFPKSSLTLLTSTNGYTIAPFLPYIDETIVYDAPWVKHKKADDFLTIVEKIKEKNFDTATIFTNFSQHALSSALLCYLAHIPNRIAYCRENPYMLLTHWIPDKESFSNIKHGVKRQLDLVAKLEAFTSDQKLKLCIGQKEYTAVISILNRNDISTKLPLICIHPGASEKKRQFSIEFFAKTAKALVEQGFQVVTTGTEKEYPLQSYIQKSCKGKTVILNNLSVGQFIALISLSNLLISNNTGPVHIASAMQTPVIVFYAQTNPEHTPWQVPSRVFYFSVPKELQSKNEILKMVSYPQPTPFTIEDVLESAKILLSQGVLKENPYVYI